MGYGRGGRAGRSGPAGGDVATGHDRLGRLAAGSVRVGLAVYLLPALLAALAVNAAAALISDTLGAAEAALRDAGGRRPWA